MTAQPNLKSTSITNLDATPPLRPTAGQGGGAAILYDITEKCGPTTSGDTTGGVLRMIRLPSNAIIKQILLTQNVATTTATFDVGIDYSDNANDKQAVNNFVSGTPLANTLFASGYDSHASPAAGWVDVTFLNTSGYLPVDTLTPIWQATNLGLTQDPMCEMDLILQNTATISGAATLLVRVIFTVLAH